jgi:hypothetical protein
MMNPRSIAQNTASAMLMTNGAILNRNMDEKFLVLTINTMSIIQATGLPTVYRMSRIPDRSLAVNAG